MTFEKSRGRNITIPRWTSWRIFSGIFVGICSGSVLANITGTVFQDFNMNGVRDTTTTIADLAGASTTPVAVDKGLANVSVTATCVTSLGADGIAGTADDTLTTFGPVVTDANGVYSITTTGVVAAPANGSRACRVSFSWSGTAALVGTAPNLLPNPLYGMYPTFVGSGSNTQTQFVNDGATVDLGLNYPPDFCQNNPNLAAACSMWGPYNGANVASRSIGVVPYAARSVGTGGNAPNPVAPATDTPIAKAGETGTLWGLAYNKQTKQLYSTAYLRSRAGLGPLGPGGIYATSMAGVTTSWADLEALKPGSAGVDPRLPIPPGYNWDGDNLIKGTDDKMRAGKVGLGDAEMSEDMSKLYVIGLASKKLYTLPIGAGGTAPAAAAIVETTLPIPADCNVAGDVQPMALKAYKGLLYVGLTCTAESTQLATNLRAYVYRWDGTTFTQVVNQSLVYARDAYSGDPNPAWTPWNDSRAERNYQPLLADIEFENDQAMILGLRDRNGDGAGAVVYSDGDMIRECYDPASGTYTSAACASATTQDGLQHYATGRGSKHIFYDPPQGPRDPNGPSGGLAQVPGFPNIVAVTKDPVRQWTAGLNWFPHAVNNASGGTPVAEGFKAYEYLEAYPFDGLISGKANAMGDVEALCEAAPIEVGNRIWIDTNKNGIQDPGEKPAVNVTVRLYDSAGTLLATALTNNDGEYAFANRTLTEAGVAIAFPGAATATVGTVNAIAGLTPNTTGFQIRVDNPADFLAGAPLASTVLTTANAGGDTTNNPLADLTDSDAVVGATGFATITFDTARAGQNNFGLDVGFSPVTTFSLGNRVWFDTNNDGLLNNGETGSAGVLVNLTNASGAQLYLLADGTTTTDGTAAGAKRLSLLTDSTGYYRFDGLPAGDYKVQIAPSNWTGITGTFSTGTAGNTAAAVTGSPKPLAGYASSTPGTNGATGTATGTGSTNNDDNGVNPAAVTDYPTAGVLSNTVTLGAGLQPQASGTSDIADVSATASATNAATVSPAGDASDNLAVDFGFFKLSVGNQVWNDNGNGNVALANNGVIDAGETGIAGVRVELYEAGTLVAVTYTDASGNYSFDQRNVTAADPTGAAITSLALANTAKTGVPLQVLTNYSVVVPASNATTQPNIGGFQSSADAAGTGTPLTTDSDDSATGTNPTTSNLSSATFQLVAYPETGTGTGSGTNGTASLNSNGTTNQPRVDFGLYMPTYSLGNRVWNDNGAGSGGVANDGIQNGTEPGIGSIAITLLNGSGQPLYRTASGTVTTSPTRSTAITTSTDINGYYRFDDLPAGDYQVQITKPTGYVNTANPVTSPNNDADRDNNGATETATTITSGTVTLGTGASEPVNEADLVGGAAAGNGAANGGVDNLGNMTVDFGLVAQGGVSVGNFVWIDANGNGTQDPGEGGVQGVTATLSKVGPGPITDVFGNTIPAANLVQPTDINGNYQFSGLAPGQYIVTFSNIPSGYVTTTTGSATSTGATTGANATDSNGLTATSAVLAAGQSDATLDLGLVPRYSLGNRVWNDLNNNGVFDAGEPGLGNVVVNLLKADGTPTGLTTTTDSSGYYQFTNLAPAGYIVEVVQPLGYVSSTGANGVANGPYETAGNAANTTFTGATTSDHGVTFGTGATATIRSGVVTLGEGMPTGEGADHPATLVDTIADNRSNRNVDFGLFIPASLGTVVWIDNGTGGGTANDGVKQANEPGIPGVVVRLLSGSGAPLINPATGQPIITTTDAQGLYGFNYLAPGSYMVEFVFPAGSVTTATINPSGSGSPTTNPSVGGTDNQRNEMNAVTRRSPPVALAPGQNNPNLDAGVLSFSAEPQSIPTLNEWMLLLLGLMVSALAMGFAPRAVRKG